MTESRSPGGRTGRTRGTGQMFGHTTGNTTPGNWTKLSWMSDLKEGGATGKSTRGQGPPAHSILCPATKAEKMATIERSLKPSWTNTPSSSRKYQEGPGGKTRPDLGKLDTLPQRTQARRVNWNSRSLGLRRVPSPSRVRKVKPRDLTETKEALMIKKKAERQRMR